MNNKGKKVLTIIAGSTVTFFSLCSCVIAVIAWFSFANQSKANGESVMVKASNDSGCEIEYVNLYKFNYSTLTAGNETIVNYAFPASGEVCKYLYDEGFTKKYVYDSENTVWTTENVDPAVSVMNKFDPVYLTINKNEKIINMNCNAIFEIGLKTNSHTQCYMQLDAIRKDNIEEYLTDAQILLTSCIDFDVFIPSDLDDTNFPNNEYRPSYYESLERELTDFEKTYYKISYLAYQKEIAAAAANPKTDPHSHFYGTNPLPQEASICQNRSVTFTDYSLKAYVNVNYNFEQLKKYSDKIYSTDITAILDYYFSFNFTTSIMVESVTLNQSSLSLETGDTSALTATVLPNNALDRTVTWLSSDSSVATVENGTVTAVGAGITIITAKSGNKSAVCEVTVTGGE